MKEKQIIKIINKMQKEAIEGRLFPAGYNLNNGAYFTLQKLKKEIKKLK